MLQISPGIMLAVLVSLTGLAGGIESLSRRRRKRALRKLAAAWGMTYTARDRLRITPKVASRLPVPAAADVYVLDVIYGTAGGLYRYVFTTEYTSGAVRGRHRNVRVATLSESRGRENPDAALSVTLAPDGLPLVEQYRRLAPDAPASR